MADDTIEYPPHIEPPFYGTGPLITWEPKTLLAAVKKKFDSAFDAIANDIEQQELLEPAGLYGYFPVITDDELVILLDPSDYSTEKAALHFPRTGKNGDRSMADYLRPEGDLLAVQMVTLGRGTSAWTGARSDGPVSRDAFAGGLVDDLAGRVTFEITRGLGLPAGTGLRVGFGLPGTPRLEEQKGLFELLAIEERLGVTLSGGFQMDPVHSSLGIYFHHPGAEFDF